MTPSMKSEDKKRKHFILESYQGRALGHVVKTGAKGQTSGIPVFLPDNLEKQDVLNFPAFQKWLPRFLHNLELQKKPNHSFHGNPYKLRAIDVQAADWFSETQLGFLKLQTRVQNGPEDHELEPNAEDTRGWLPGCVFLRGGAVAILFVVKGTHKDAQEQVILTVQPRVAAGSLAFIEIPAGMIDDAHNLGGKAVDEIREEVGIQISSKDLFNMSEEATKDIPFHPWTKSDSGDPAAGSESERISNAMYPSVGGCDEAITLYLCQKRLTDKAMKELEGKATGLRDEGENITLKLVPFKELWRWGGRDAKTLSALALYNSLKEAGRLPAMPERPDDEK